MINYWKSERRRARTALRNYIIENVNNIQEEFGIEIPKNVKNMSGQDFAKWIDSVRPTILKKGEIGNKLVNLFIEYCCACTNVKTAESNSTFNI